MPTPPLRLAVLGSFGHAPQVFDELLAHPDFAVEAVGWASAYPGETVDGLAWHPWMAQVPRFPSAASLLASRPDVAVISTRPDHLSATGLQALEAGCHLVMEKPLALNLPDLFGLYHAGQARQRKVLAMLTMRTLPAFLAARQAVMEGKIGRPLLLNARKSYQWGNRPEWFNHRTQYGGTWPWIGIHALDMAHFVSGLHATRSWARHANLAHPNLPGCEDAAVGMFDLEGGAFLSVSLDLCRPGHAATWGDDWLRVVGTQGVLEANGSTGHLHLLPADGPAQTRDCGTAPAPMFLPFLRSLGEPAATPDPDPFQLTAAALTARESADAGGHPIEIPLIASLPPNQLASNGTPQAGPEELL